jgi:hypothetical protein
MQYNLRDALALLLDFTFRLRVDYDIFQANI